jgi:hypothetical protein
MAFEMTLSGARGTDLGFVETHVDAAGGVIATVKVVKDVHAVSQTGVPVNNLSGPVCII